MSDTIVAQCTPIGSGVIAMIRISGPQALAITDQFTQLIHNKKLAHQPANTIHYGSIKVAAQQLVDRAMFAVMRAPKSFTGENTVEISCHNNQLIVMQIINLALKHGARLAQRGEFSQQAFLNQKLDLLQAEAIHELITAHNQQALQKSLSQLEGTFSHWINRIEQQLIQILALSEASFEFLDDETIEFKTQISILLQKTSAEVERVQNQFNPQLQLKNGLKIAIIGPTNAGKSSLFNILLQQNRAIVTATPGTTRDTIESGLQLEGVITTLIDTAGLRSTVDQIEQAGITRSWQAAQTADLIILLLDRSQTLSASEQQIYAELLQKYKTKTICTLNKLDLPIQLQLIPELAVQNFITISVQQKQNLSALQQRLLAKIAELTNQDHLPFLLNQRHHNALSNLIVQLRTCQQLLDLTSIDYEILSLELHKAVSFLSELTGQSITTQAMDKIFREFCIGK